MNENTSKRKAFTQWCRDELFDDKLISASAMLQTALDVHLVDIFSRLGFSQHLKAPSTAEDLCAALGYVDSAAITLDAFLERLSAKYSFVAKDVVDDVITYQLAGAVPDVAGDKIGIAKELANVDGAYLTTLEFLEFGNERFEYSLKDDPEFLDRILSGREPEWADLWFRATNTDPLQNVHGIMGAVAIDALFDGGDILEIGGGTGNGIRNLFQHLAQKNELDRVKSYTFTDISQKFIMSTRKEIRRDFPDTNTDWRFCGSERSSR